MPNPPSNTASIHPCNLDDTINVSIVYMKAPGNWADAAFYVFQYDGCIWYMDCKTNQLVHSPTCKNPKHTGITRQDTIYKDVFKLPE